MYRFHRKYCVLTILQRFFWYVAPSLVIAIATLFLDFLAFILSTDVTGKNATNPTIFYGEFLE